MLERAQFLCYDGKKGGRVPKGLPETITRDSAKNQREVRKSPLYKVLMHNDDYTSMEFVVEVLETVFHKSSTEANQIMLNVHFRGVGLCGVYTHEIAETRISRVHAMARSAGFPLRCSMEQG